MAKIYVTQTDTYVIDVETIEEAQVIWRSYLIDGSFGMEVDFIEGSSHYTEIEDN